MKSVYNQQTLLWTIGVLQPVSIVEIQAYWSVVFEKAGQIPDVSQLRKLCVDQLKDRRIIRVHRRADPSSLTERTDLYSLTERGNRFLIREQRYSRDKARLFLLKDARRDRLSVSREETAAGLGGVAPSADTRITIKGREANKNGPVVPSGHSYWPRFNWQLFKDTGLRQTSRDIPYLPLLSFADEKQLALAANEPSKSLELDFRSIGLMLGISPGLIVRIMVNPDGHYRSFELPKRNGGTRQIESPRTFLKVIQQFLVDYYLSGLPVHNCVQSFRCNHSIITNASQHCGKSYVANIDIENYFGSIDREGVENILQKASYGAGASAIVSSLCTKWGTLPQGAPTSPAISNAYLYEFDEAIEQQCSARNLSYTRYADDITMSGDELEKIREMVECCRKLLLEKFRLRLNEKKTRIASQHGQQRVTGVIVNDAPRPPKKFRRGVRAAFHNASTSSDVSTELVDKLSGYINYLHSFDALKGSMEVSRYRQELVKIRELLN